MEGENNNNGYKKGLWTEEEDRILIDYIRVHGKGKWNHVAKATGLRRCGKSCRLRWMNYLSPNVKRGDFSAEEEDLIIRLHKLLGNRWSLIAGRVPGRTDNQVKNHWNTHLSKRLGVRKEKCKKIASPRISLKEIKKHPSTQPQSNKIPPKEDNRGTEQKSTGEEIQEETRSDNAQASAIDDSYQSSFWFLNDDLSFYPSNLIEYLDEYSLDFVWHGL